MPSYMINIPDDVDRTLKEFEKKGLIKDKPTYIWAAVREKLNREFTTNL